MKITFDTNSLDKVCRPELSPKDPKRELYSKINRAIISGTVIGFYSATLITIEGIQKKDRAKVFGNTKIVRETSKAYVTKNSDLSPDIRKFVGNKDIDTIPVTLTVIQEDRQPLHPKMIERIEAARKLGFRALKSPPRVGLAQAEDSTGDLYLDNGEGEELSKWLDTISKVTEEIEKRQVGMHIVKNLGEKIAQANSLDGPWYKGLLAAKDVHEENAIKRAFSEWADGDSVAAHIAYGLDIFCTSDEGKHSGSSSVLGSTNKTWLSETYGIKFCTIDDVANCIQ